MYLDTHVHLRDFNQEHKETIAHGLEVARDSGVDAVFDMPNPDPAVLTLEIAMKRIHRAHEARVPGVFYGVYMGMTADQEQVKNAISATRKVRQIVGQKMYAGHSTGNLGVTREEDQFMVYHTNASEGYKGVLVVHCEKESCMDHSKWNPQIPISHCHARPEHAEVESVRDQLRMAKDAGFQGKLHIAHISSPDAVDLVADAKAEGLDVSCGVCPHHFIYDWGKMFGADGVMYKMNPPLREAASRAKMFDYLKSGRIDWIETDHAPHALGEKRGAPFASGIPGLPWWPMFEEYLRRQEFRDMHIQDLVFNNAAARFGLDIKRSKRKVKDRRADYPFDPYSPMASELGWK